MKWRKKRTIVIWDKVKVYIVNISQFKHGTQQHPKGKIYKNLGRGGIAHIFEYEMWKKHPICKNWPCKPWSTVGKSIEEFWENNTTT